MFRLEQQVGTEWIVPVGWMLPQPDAWNVFAGCRLQATQADDVLELTGGVAAVVLTDGSVVPFPLVGTDFLTAQAGSLRVKADVPGAAGFTPLFLVNSRPTWPLCGMTLCTSGTTAMSGTIQEALPVSLRVQYFPAVNPAIFPVSVSGGTTIASGAL